MYSKEELKNLKIEFWEGFDNYCRTQSYLQGRDKMWVLYDTKVKNVELKFDATRDGASVILEICHRSDDARLEMFERISWHKATLEQDLGDELIWDLTYTRDTGKQVCRIYCFCEGLDIHRRAHWDGFYEYMARKMFLLERNFMEIRDYLQD